MAISKVSPVVREVRSMDYRELVEDTVRSLGLLDARGALVRLDSLMILDLVIALEDPLGVTIPMGELPDGTFDSIDSVANMLATLAPMKRTGS
jgi:hypothetical protein